MSWNRSSDDSVEKRSIERFNKGGGYRSLVLRCVIVAAVVFIGAVVVWWFLASKSNVPSSMPTKKDKTLKSVAPSREKEANPVPKVTVTQPAHQQGQPVVTTNMTTVATNGQQRLDRWGNPKHKPRFKSPTEYCLAMLFSTPLGKPPPPLPHIPEWDLAKMDEILNRPTEMLPDDSEALKEKKRICDLAKKEFKEFLENGGLDTEFFEYYRGKLMNYYRQWSDGQQMVDEAYESGGESLARETADKINQLFNAKGLRAVSVPKPNDN